MSNEQRLDDLEDKQRLFDDELRGRLGNNDDGLIGRVSHLRKDFNDECLMQSEFRQNQNMFRDVVIKQLAEIRVVLAKDARIPMFVWVGAALLFLTVATQNAVVISKLMELHLSMKPPAATAVTTSDGHSGEHQGHSFGSLDGGPLDLRDLGRSSVRLARGR